MSKKDIHIHSNKKSFPSVSAESVRARIDVRRSMMDRVADYLTALFGTVSFLFINAAFFFVWITVNLGWWGIKEFDHFPFGLLTMIVSLEAIFLAIIVLISQNRQSHVADIRQQMDLEINLRAEQETTRAIRMLDEIHDHLGLDPKDDKELVEMKKNLDINKLEQIIEKEIG